MIHIERGDKPAIAMYKAVPPATNSAYDKEYAEAVAFYANEAYFKADKCLTKKKFEFTLYKDEALKEELKKLFKGKCAYCESIYEAVSPEDIEHFRPKGSINPYTLLKNETEKKPGYYWLAADWDNLLISCIDCNRERKHVHPGSNGKVNLGKKDKFPLLDESKRIRSHKEFANKLEEEEKCRLLLNPCVDDPQIDLRFDPKDGMVYPRNSSKKGEASIMVYGLFRKELVDARCREVIKFEGHLVNLVTAIKHIVRLKSNPRHDPESLRGFTVIHNVAVDQLKLFMRPEAPYLAIKRQVLEDFSQTPDYASFKQYLKIDLKDVESLRHVNTNLT